MGVQQKIQALIGKEGPPIVGVDAVSKEMGQSGNVSLDQVPGGKR